MQLENTISVAFATATTSMGEKLMAKTTKTAEELVELTSAKVKRLTVRNLRCIGKEPVSIDLNDIVVLVGPNNAGKTTLLKAYEAVMNHARLKSHDFPFENCDQDHCTEENCPRVELETYVDGNCGVGAEWITVEPETGRRFIRERWTWYQPDKDPDRQGFSFATNDWSDKVPWGAPNYAKSHRPFPHPVDAFAPPETQADEIIRILQEAITDNIKAMKPEPGTDVAKLIDDLKKLQAIIVSETKEDINKIEDGVSEIIAKVFPGYKVEFDPGLEENPDLKNVLFGKPKASLRMGPVNGHLSPIAYQGSGARRTLLWAALKLVSETQKNSKGGDRPHLLLLDEPEICLHPNAIRDACETLYDLAEADEAPWQVMITTHSPAFIDLSRDNTTIVRVERTDNETIRGTTVFRPDRVRLTDDDKEELKLLNACDPYVAEFFFGGRIIVVEGDTEYSAFRKIISENPDEFRDLQIIRARGKATIVALMKILNQFAASYAVLHDSDTPKNSKGEGNSAWTINSRILGQVPAATGGAQVRLLASIINFDAAFLSQQPKADKPYAAITKLNQDSAAYARVKALLSALVDHSAPVPEGALEWHTLDELSEPVEKKLTTVTAKIA